MPWPSVYLALLLSHLAGDFLLQTEWQAMNKRYGTGPDPEQRRALTLHALTYTAAYVPAMIWLASELGPLEAVAAALAIAVRSAALVRRLPLRLQQEVPRGMRDDQDGEDLDPGHGEADAIRTPLARKCSSSRPRLP